MADDGGARASEGWRAFARWFSIVSAIALLMFSYRYLDPLAAGGKADPLEPFITETTGAFSAGILYFGIAALVRRRPLRRGDWAGKLPIYLVALVLFALAHTSMMWASRAAIFPLAGLGRYDYGIMPLRYLMEAPFQVISFVLVVGAVHAARSWRSAREQEVRSARLERDLVNAQLASLRVQLQPHFLFNSLNTISATMYEDPASADELLERLADLLRSSLRTERTDEVPLTTELATLESYLSLVRARFGERLNVTVESDPAVADALVPSMLLQPLVENAIRHGGVEKRGRGTIEIRARRDEAILALEVEDDGPGSERAEIDAARARPGLGLTATRERLRLLYGAEQKMSAENREGGGFRVSIRLPSARDQGGGGVIRTLIVDDEAPARSKVRKLLAPEAGFEIVGEAADGDEAVRRLLELRPDVVFLDIQMPHKDGFAVVEEIGVERMPLVVFVTAYDEHALRAFEVHALDYLLKPFAAKRFHDVLERVRERLAGRFSEQLGARLEQLLAAARPRRRHLTRILLARSDERELLIPVEKIDRIRAERNYLRFVTHQGEFLRRGTLRELGERLDPERFLRINRSEIVRLDAIVEVAPWFHGDYRIRLHDGTELSWSRRFRARSKAAF